MKKTLMAFLFATASTAWAEADYSFACQMEGAQAVVYACNSGNSAEGNNHYIYVQACVDGRDCDDDYDLMYVYASSGGCDEIGRIEFDERKTMCMARYREGLDNHMPSLY